MTGLTGNKNNLEPLEFTDGVEAVRSYLPDPLTREALFTLFPHPAKVVTLELSGVQVLGILEQSAGLRWTVDYNRPPGNRLNDVSVRGRLIEPERYYRVATNAGMQGRLHNYTTFSQGRNIERHDLRLHDLVEPAMRKQVIVNPSDQGDITLIGKG